MAIANAADFGVMRVDFKQVFFAPSDIFSPPRLRTDVVL
jgi:hypothetical protein